MSGRSLRVVALVAGVASLAGAGLVLVATLLLWPRLASGVTTLLLLAVADVGGSAVACAAAFRLWRAAAQGEYAARAALRSLLVGAGAALMPGLLAFGLHIERQFTLGVTALDLTGDGAVLAVCGFPAIPALLAIVARGRLCLDPGDPPAPRPWTWPRAVVRLAALLMAAALGVAIGRETALHPSRQPIPDTPEGWVERFRADHPAALRVLVSQGAAAAVPLAKAIRDDGAPSAVAAAAIDRAVATLAGRLPAVCTFRTRVPLPRGYSLMYLEQLYCIWGPNARGAMPVLAEALGGDESRRGAHAALRGLGTVPGVGLTELVARAGPAPTARAAAAAAFVALAPKPARSPALALLVEGLALPDRSARHFVISALGDLRTAARPAIVALLAGHPGADSRERAWALRAASRIAPEHPEVVRAIATARTSGTMSPRDLSMIESPTERIDPTALSSAARSGPAGERTSALLRVVHNWRTLSAATEILTSALRDADPEIRAQTAVWCLGNEVPGVGDAQAVWLACLRSSVPADRCAAVRAAVYHHSGEADGEIPRLVIAALDDASPLVRATAALPCLQNRWAELEALVRLEALARSPDTKVRREVFGYVMLDARRRHPGFVRRVAGQALEDPDPMIRWGALRALAWPTPRE